MSHILLIDDDKAIGEVMSIVLNDLGHSSTILSSFNELKKIEQITADLILLDGNLGVNSGQEIADYIKEHSLLGSTPIVIFSADDSAEKIAEDIHAQGVLKKPFEIETLSRVIQSHALS